MSQKHFQFLFKWKKGSWYLSSYSYLHRYRCVGRWAPCPRTRRTWGSWRTWAQRGGRRRAGQAGFSGAGEGQFEAGILPAWKARLRQNFFVLWFFHCIHIRNTRVSALTPGLFKHEADCTDLNYGVGIHLSWFIKAPMTKRLNCKFPLYTQKDLVVDNFNKLQWYLSDIYSEWHPKCIYSTVDLWNSTLLHQLHHSPQLKGKLTFLSLHELADGLHEIFFCFYLVSGTNHCLAVL